VSPAAIPSVVVTLSGAKGTMLDMAPFTSFRVTTTLGMTNLLACPRSTGYVWHSVQALGPMQ